MAKPKIGVTQYLRSYSKKTDQPGFDELALVVHERLHQLARYYMKREGNCKTLQPTALVNEAFLRIFEGKSPKFNDRAHFFNIAAQVMRHILIDKAREKMTKRRGERPHLVNYEEAMDFSQGEPNYAELIVLDDALKKLEKLDQRLFRIVELRYFGGLDIEETASVMGCSTGTVKRDWAKARGWLKKEVGPKG